MDLRVEEDNTANWQFFNLFSPFQTVCFIPAAILTLVIEVQTAKLYSKRLKKPIRHVVTANLISLPIVWFIIPNWLEIEFLWLFIVVELFAIIFEAVFIVLVNRTSGFTFKNGLVTSIITNLASIEAGFVLIGILLLIVYVAVRI